MTRRCPRCRRAFDPSVLLCPEDGVALVVPSLPDPSVVEALAADYRILDWLGSGGMGTVYVAEQVRVGRRKVALKLLHRRFCEDEEFTTRFQNEAASTGRINHPNVITIYESKRAPDGSLYIAMELVEGESLTDRLRTRGPLPLEEAVEIVSQCCKALQTAHRLGIIHRDVKPDNIMLTRDADGALLVKILDFGIAKLKDSGGHTVTGSVLGTPAYMSYEQASGMSSDKLDGRSDLYSLGLVTYAMLVGHPPFRAETPVGYITKHLTEPVPPLRRERPEIPPAVEAVVLRVLEKDRERRYQTAAEFAAALRSAAQARVPDPLADRGLESQPTPPPPWRPRPAAAAPTERPGAPAAPGARSEALPPPARAGEPSGGPPSRSPGAAPPAARALAGLLEPVGATPPRRVPVVGPRAAPEALETGPPGAPRASRTPAERARSASARGRVVSWEGLAAAVWGLRTLASWVLAAYAVVFLVLFGWPFLAPFAQGSLIVPAEVVGQPVLQQVRSWLPWLRVGGVDFLPLALAVALLGLRARIRVPLLRLEERWRARAVSPPHPLG